LGLAIVKQLVEPQGGSIQVASQVGKGSTFSFILNFQKTDIVPEMEVVAEESHSDNKSISILVVEDMPLNQLLMKTLLDDFGFDRDIAENGQIAVDKLQEKTYDVILMDLQMPIMNGYEATDYIRNVMKSSIPIIALTADVTTIDLEKCRYVGMNDYIAKPVDEQSLYTKIMSLVKKQAIIETAAVEVTVELAVEAAIIKRCIDLEYLNRRTKSNPTLMMEMITLYLEQTPPLIIAMKKSLAGKDWQGLHSAVHKMIPSFAIMGISSDFENMARKVQDFATTQCQAEGISEMVIQLDNICTQACRELEEEFIKIKDKK
jgi:CheY-like chemotaxis protein